MWKKIGIVLIFLFGIFVFSGCQFKPDQKSEDYEKVIQTIQNLPNTEDLVLADKENVEAAFSQYNALTESAKAKVSNYQKLNAARAKIQELEAIARADMIDSKISELTEPVTLADESLYLEIKELITETSEVALERVKNFLKFNNMYSQYEVLKEQFNNKTEILNNINQKIAALASPTNLEDGDRYNAIVADLATLSEEDKEGIELLEQFNTKYQEYLQLKAIDDINTKIALLKTPVTLADEKLYLELRETIDNASSEVLAKIEGKETFEEKYLDYLSLKDLENRQAARVVDDLISNLPDVVSKSDKEAIENARKKYEQLTEAQKELVTKLPRLVQKEEELALFDELQNMSAEEQAAVAFARIADYYSENYIIEEDQNFYQRNPVYGKLTFTWTASDNTVLSPEGKLLSKPVFDSQIIINVKAVSRRENYEGSIDISALVLGMDSEYDKWGMVEKFLNYINRPYVSNRTYKYHDNYSAQYHKDYGYLPFFTNYELPIVESMLTGENAKKTNGPATSIEWVVVHDTGSYGAADDAPSIDRYIHTPAKVSWNYTVGEKTVNGTKEPVIYYHMQEGMTTWQAGDGGNLFSLLDTGVAHKGRLNPKVTIGEDRYFYLNGEKTNLMIPSNAIADNRVINENGLLVELGENGNYMMADYWWCTQFNNPLGVRGYICNKGGNRNSVSMETCANDGSNYTRTMRYIAALCAEILIRHNLPVDRVSQHHRFSGKDCPHAIRAQGYWNDFMEQVKIEWFGRKYLSDVTFVYEVDSYFETKTGVVMHHPGAQTTVNYKVKATYQGVTKEFTYRTILEALSF
ncbi:MAG TPA: hypothetical protein GXZ51_03910 [Acholeplasma sp.]|nr:hypothetical protein [Acholeplasma sp.]